MNATYSPPTQTLRALRCGPERHSQALEAAYALRSPQQTADDLDQLLADARSGTLSKKQLGCIYSMAMFSLAGVVRAKEFEDENVFDEEPTELDEEEATVIQGDK
jgi:hypothetical protein